jgi:hypothetical protein
MESRWSSADCGLNVTPCHDHTRGFNLRQSSMMNGHTAPIVPISLGFLVNQKEEPSRVTLLFSLEQILRLKRCGRVRFCLTSRLGIRCADSGCLKACDRVDNISLRDRLLTPRHLYKAKSKLVRWKRLRTVGCKMIVVFRNNCARVA